MITRNYIAAFVSPIVLITILFITSCRSEVSLVNENFDPQTKRELIVELGKKWSEGIKKQDVSIISNLYDENSKYFPSDYKVLYGNKEITDYWAMVLKFLVDIRLNLRTIEGTEDLLIETGDGIGIYYSSETKIDTTLFNYVNLWKLQEEGNYKVVLDIYKER